MMTGSIPNSNLTEKTKLRIQLITLASRLPSIDFNTPIDLSHKEIRCKEPDTPYNQHPPRNLRPVNTKYKKVRRRVYPR